MANYDLVVDTTNITPEEAAEIIKREYFKWLEKQQKRIYFQSKFFFVWWEKQIIQTAFANNKFKCYNIADMAMPFKHIEVKQKLKYLQTST